MIDFFIAYRKPERAIAAPLLFPKPYIAIQETVALPKPEAEQRLKKYLEKECYQGSRACYWYNNHMSHYNTYFSYWSFEVGAIAKIRGLDDSSFKDNEYYRYDLVHWKEAT